MDESFESEPLVSSGNDVVRESAPLEAATSADALSSSVSPDTDENVPVDGVIEVAPVGADGDETDTAVSSGSPADTSSSEDVAEAAADQPDPLAEIRDQLAQLTEQTTKHHERASQRESVIDNMHSELEQLRRGERRSLLRPLVTEVCRLRDDLLRQADTLPADFDQQRAADLLRSYADSLEFTLEDNGITTFAPEIGEPFQARLHRVASKAPTRDSALVGTIAGVASPGYRDIEADAVVASARVVVHVADESEREPAHAAAADAAGSAPKPPSSDPESASAPVSTSADAAPAAMPATGAAD